MKLSRRSSLAIILGLLTLAVLPPAIRAEDGGDSGDGGDGGDGDDGGDDGGDGDGDDGGNDAQEYYSGGDDWLMAEVQYSGRDAITYWTDYAVRPKACIKFKGSDVVVFTVHDNAPQQCSDNPVGTYYTPVSTFLQAYLSQLVANQMDMGNDDFALPGAAEYAQCTYTTISGEPYYLMAGCADGDSKAIAANIYSDDACQNRSAVDGSDDTNVDMSEVQIPFGSCKACVAWVDRNDDAVDDQYYENKQTNPPLCSRVWAEKSKCRSKCKRLSSEKGVSGGWNGADLLLLFVVAAFAAGLLGAIVWQRRKIDEKENGLLADPSIHHKEGGTRIPEQRLYQAFGGTFSFLLLFAVFGASTVTWFIILCMNVVLFGYLLKLVVEYSYLPSDDDDDDDEDDDDDVDDEEEAKGSSPRSMS